MTFSEFVEELAEIANLYEWYFVTDDDGRELLRCHDATSNRTLTPLQAYLFHKANGYYGNNCLLLLANRYGISVLLYDAITAAANNHKRFQAQREQLAQAVGLTVYSREAWLE